MTNIRIYALDDTDWWAGESLQACIAEARAQCGAGSYCDAEEEGYELTDEQMQRFVFHDDDDEARSFAAQLERELAEGGTFPRLFASTDF